MKITLRSNRVTQRIALACALGALLFACGGSSDSSPPPPVAPPDGTTDPGPTPPTAPPTTLPPSGDTEWTPPVVAMTSPGCGTPQGQASGAAYTTPSGRTFHVYGPTGYDQNKTYPVVMMFHGIQSDGASFQQWFEMEKYVSNEAFVVYPDAIGGYWDVNGDTDLKMFDEVIKQVGQTYCINPSRVLGFGFSWGAFFAHHLGCNRAGYVHAISGGEGGFGGAAQKCGRLPVLVTHRTKDTNEPISHGIAAAGLWTKLDVCGTDTVADATMNCTMHQSCKNPGGPVTFCEDTSTMNDIPGYDPTWDHTVRENYRQFTYDWFKALP
jgi:polyhydroxybutyrate depolymerase